jgi:hypothetical protein
LTGGGKARPRAARRCSIFAMGHLVFPDALNEPVKKVAFLKLLLLPDQK